MLRGCAMAPRRLAVTLVAAALLGSACSHGHDRKTASAASRTTTTVAAATTSPSTSAVSSTSTSAPAPNPSTSGAPSAAGGCPPLPPRRGPDPERPQYV